MEEISRVDNLIKDYIDFVYRDYVSYVSCPISYDAYNDWFIHNFLQSCITRWYEPSCYDISEMISVDTFFENNVVLFSDILQILNEYFEDFSRTMVMGVIDPKNIMRCYTSVFVCKNISYFLDRYRDEFDGISNPRGDSSDITSLDLFISSETEEGETDNESEDNSPVLNNYDDDMRDVEEEDGDDDETVDDGEYYETGVYVTEAEFLEKNTNVECIICWDVLMNYENSMKWNNCNHFSCETCHMSCYVKKIRKCPLCRS